MRGLMMTLRMRLANISSFHRAEPSPIRRNPTCLRHALSPRARTTISHLFSAEKRPIPTSSTASGSEPQRFQRSGAQLGRAQAR